MYESLFVELLPKSGKHIIVVVIYRPNTLVDIFTTTLFGVTDVRSRASHGLRDATDRATFRRQPGTLHCAHALRMPLDSRKPSEN